MIAVLEKPQVWHPTWVPVHPALDTKQVPGCPRPAPPKPLIASEIVELICRPVNDALHQVGERWVAAARLASFHSLEAEDHIQDAVLHASVARQHIDVARLIGTAPWEGTPAVYPN